MAHTGLLALHYSSYGVRCGIADFAADLVNGLKNAGVDSQVVPIDFAQNLNLSSADLQRQYDELAAAASRYDVVHIQHEYSFFGRHLYEAESNFAVCLEQLVHTGKPILVTFHTEDEIVAPEPSLKSRLKWKVKRALAGAKNRMRGTRGLYAYAKIMRRHPQQIRGLVHTRRTRQTKIGLGVPPESLDIVPIGFPRRTANLNVDKLEARRQLNIPTGVKLLSVFGFISRYKGPHTAVRALKVLPPDYRLALIGGLHPNSSEGILDKVLKVWRDQDPERLTITGYLPAEQADLWQAASDIVLAPYLETGMSGSAAINWALSSGKPVIASKTHTFREIYENSGAMLMVTPDSPYELAWLIRRLENSKDLAAELVRKARAYATENSWDRVAERIAKIYSEMSGIPLHLPGESKVPLRSAA